MKTAQSSFYFLVLARPSPFLFIPYTMDGFVLPPVEALGGTLTLDELRVRRTSFLRGGQIGQRVHPRSPPSPSSPFARFSPAALPPLAMVNVDFSPALVLGAGLVGGGLALYQLRRLRPYLSRDFDVVVSSIAIFRAALASTR